MNIKIQCKYTNVHLLSYHHLFVILPQMLLVELRVMSNEQFLEPKCVPGCDCIQLLWRLIPLEKTLLFYSTIIQLGVTTVYPLCSFWQHFILKSGQLFKDYLQSSKTKGCSWSYWHNFNSLCLVCTISNRSVLIFLCLNIVFCFIYFL